jgi:hypothetical protein
LKLFTLQAIGGSRLTQVRGTIYRRSRLAAESERSGGRSNDQKHNGPVEKIAHTSSFRISLTTSTAFKEAAAMAPLRLKPAARGPRRLRSAEKGAARYRLARGSFKACKADRHAAEAFRTLGSGKKAATTKGRAKRSAASRKAAQTRKRRANE